MRVDELKREADAFVEEGSCYIHTEMVRGKCPQTIISGDYKALLWGIVAELTRVGEITNTDFATAVDMALTIHKIGYKKAENLQKGTIQVIDGDDWQEKWKAETKKELSKDNHELEIKVNSLKIENESLKNLVLHVKKANESTVSAKNREIDRLNKQILMLEHRLTEMEEALQFGGEHDT